MADFSPRHPGLTLLMLLGVTCLLLLFTVDVRVTDLAGVRMELPDHLPPNWEGHQVLFCQDPQCGRPWLERDVPPEADGSRHCPENWRGEPCGGELFTMSLGEKLVLPLDTEMRKKQYFDAGRPEHSVFTSIVLSGRDRTSIHRPEVCMTGQGNVIESSEVIEVPLPDRPPVNVMVLNMSRSIPGARTRHSYYAYWFVGRDRETPHHHERLLWMSLDRIFRNVAHRWAYIAVAGERGADLEDTAHHAEIREVVGGLYPQISLQISP